MLESRPAYSGFVSGVGRQAYNQAAFRHFLAIERLRAQTTSQTVLLVLVSGRRVPGAAISLSDATAASVFRGLGESVREVDFVGWFREGRVAGAVLAPTAGAAGDEAQQLMAERVMQTLIKHLSMSQASNLRVRVVRLASYGADQSEPARALSGY